MARFSVLFDANVLVPVALADTFLRLAEGGLFRPLWSTRILDEMVWAIETIHPDLVNGAARRRANVMEGAFDDACVTGWEPLVPGINLPDDDDRHVVAAAQRGRADMIVTANLRDFPEDELEALGLERQSPDDFLLNQLDLDPDRVIRVLYGQSDDTKKPHLTFDALLDLLSRSGAPQFAETARHQRWRGQ